MISIRILFLLSIFHCVIAYSQHINPISNIQGNKSTSDLVGTHVKVKGIVTASFQDEKSFAGFFIQNSKNIASKNKSQGIFVYESKTKVKVGDLIIVTGLVSEHNGVTQISDVINMRTLKKGQKLPTAVKISLPLKGRKLEHLEGMLVTLDHPGIISDHYNYIKYGEFVVSSKVLMGPTNTVLPGSKANEVKKYNADDRLLIDDGSFSQFPDFDKIDQATKVRIGAKVQLVGIMHYAFDKYRIELTQPVKFLDVAKIKKNRPDKIKGNVRVASFNLRNFFTTIDKGQTTCGPLKNFGCRGADSKNELKRQQAKLVSAIRNANADIYAIQELENNTNSIKALVSALNHNVKNNPWHFIKTGTLGEDVIRVGLIYKDKKVKPIGVHKILNQKVMHKFEADKNRDVLLQTFKDSKNNKFNVAVVHLKSKRCTDAIDKDKDQNDGQGCYNASRVRAADLISSWLNKDPTGQKASATMVVGDFNSYTKEDPITIFAKKGFSHLAGRFLKPENWTSIFRGEVGSIDHILVNKAAQKAAKGMTQWHINSVVQGWFDYNLEDLTKNKSKPKNYYQINPFASSDHDMVIAGFTFSK